MEARNRGEVDLQAGFLALVADFVLAQLIIAKALAVSGQILQASFLLHVNFEKRL
jgi:hypothetical protein